MLQILCLASLNKDVNRSTFSLAHRINLTQEQRSQSHKISLRGVMVACIEGHLRSLKEASESLRPQLIEPQKHLHIISGECRMVGGNSQLYSRKRSDAAKPKAACLRRHE